MSGRQIGGVIGGAIGFYFGGVQGMQYGFAIGSAVGGYVDPDKVYGPRLEDAAMQTSTVGGVIPFGDGEWTTAGNIIWAAPLVEHRKSERQGKGSGVKNITYTYTRSYAIGVAEGTIYEYIWIKINGKLIYAANPRALGTMMGWNAKLIADLTASSTKFLGQVTLYRGTSDQMPDSAIEADVGIGKVSAFRDLAYIVVEDFDLTNERGAIGMHEFCVNATPPEVYLTSKPYPIQSEDYANYTAALTGGVMKDIVVEATAKPERVPYAARVTGGYLGIALQSTRDIERANYAVELSGGVLKSVLEVGHSNERANYEVALSDGTLRRTLVTLTTPVEKVNYEVALTDGEML